MSHTRLTLRFAIRVDGHYLNLPVVESDGRLVGIVDVLKLTYATLEQVSMTSFLPIYITMLTITQPLLPDRIDVGRQDQHRRRSHVEQILRRSRYSRRS
jgi:hypothetical protein